MGGESRVGASEDEGGMAGNETVGILRAGGKKMGEKLETSPEQTTKAPSSLVCSLVQGRGPAKKKK